MRTITIADESGTTGWFRDVEETIEEAVTWAEDHGLHVTLASGAVYVRERVDTCTHCGTTTFITYGSACFLCADATEPEWVEYLHTEHYEGMMREMNE